MHKKVLIAAEGQPGRSMRTPKEEAVEVWGCTYWED